MKSNKKMQEIAEKNNGIYEDKHISIDYKSHTATFFTYECYERYIEGYNFNTYIPDIKKPDINNFSFEIDFNEGLIFTDVITFKFYEGYIILEIILKTHTISLEIETEFETDNLFYELFITLCKNKKC